MYPILTLREYNIVRVYDIRTRSRVSEYPPMVDAVLFRVRCEVRVGFSKFEICKNSVCMPAGAESCEANIAIMNRRGTRKC